MKIDNNNITWNSRFFFINTFSCALLVGVYTVQAHLIYFTPRHFHGASGKYCDPQQMSKAQPSTAQHRKNSLAHIKWFIILLHPHCVLKTASRKTQAPTNIVVMKHHTCIIIYLIWSFRLLYFTYVRMHANTRWCVYMCLFTRLYIIMYTLS